MWMFYIDPRPMEYLCHTIIRNQQGKSPNLCSSRHSCWMMILILLWTFEAMWQSNLTLQYNQDLLPFSNYLFSNKPSFTITTQYSWTLDSYELWTIIKNRFLEVTQGHLTNSKWDHSMSILENKDLNSLWWWGDQLGNNQRARRFWSGGIHEDSS